jgi:hypothetical protein
MSNTVWRSAGQHAFDWQQRAEQEHSAPRHETGSRDTIRTITAAASAIITGRPGSRNRKNGQSS